MKKIITSVFVVLSALTACTVQNQGQSYDEVYYNPKDGSTFVQSKTPLLHKTTKETVIKTDSRVPIDSYVGNTASNTQGYKAQKDSGAYVDNSFNYDDYYDYSYASRIRRFQYSPFNDYYHDFYTNRYWYDYNPGYWGSSIYNNWGMGMGMSSYMDPFSMSWGMYSPFNNFYDPFNSPFSFGYSPFGYGFGYNGGYYNNLYGYGYGGYGGYGGGLYSYTGGYNNSLDNNSKIHYGPRRDGAGTNGPIPSERTAFSQRYNGINGLTSGGGGSAVTGPSTGRQVMSSNGAAGSTANPNLRDKVAATNQNATGRNLRDAGNGNLFSSSPSNAQNVAGQRQMMNRQNLNRYVSDPAKDQQVTGRRPDARSVQQQQSGYFKDRAIINGNQQYAKPTQNAAPQQYYNPTNARPRSSNEYTSPGYRNPAIYNSQQYTPQQRSVSDPSRYAPVRTYSAPASSGSSSRSGYTPSSYSSPTPSSYSAPSQTYSAPSQSSSSSSGRSEAPSSSSSSGSSSGSSSSGGGTVSSPRR
jgi:hypothetical protein